jgi:hypothetical protein
MRLSLISLISFLAACAFSVISLVSYLWNERQDAMVEADVNRITAKFRNFDADYSPNMIHFSPDLTPSTVQAKPDTGIQDFVDFYENSDLLEKIINSGGDPTDYNIKCSSGSRDNGMLPDYDIDYSLLPDGIDIKMIEKYLEGEKDKGVTEMYQEARHVAESHMSDKKMGGLLCAKEMYMKDKNKRDTVLFAVNS